MSDDEIKSTNINFTYDEHGHPELGNVSKAHIFNILIQRELKTTGIECEKPPSGDWIRNPLCTANCF